MKVRGRGVPGARLPAGHGEWMAMSGLLAICALLVIGLVVLPLFGPRVAAIAAVAAVSGILVLCYGVCVSRMAMILILLTVLVSASDVVFAHKERLPEDALTLVRQASALMAQDPSMKEEIRERLQGALRAKKVEGVDLARVREALGAYDQGSVVQARRLLAEALEPALRPRPPTGPRRGEPPPPARAGRTPRAVPPSHARGASMPMEVSMRMAEPLGSGFTGSRIEMFLLAIATALVATGVFTLGRSRGAPGQ